MALELTEVPQKALVVRRDRSIVAASWFGPWVRRPYVYPFLGPSGLETTRLDHPLDPVSHSHHKSIWISHHDVRGVDFWSDSPRSGRIVQTGVENKKEKGRSVKATLVLSWQGPGGVEVMRERRTLTFTDLPRDELMLDIDSHFEGPDEKSVVLGKSNFGVLGIRVARTMRVHERLGGRITNSDDAENEQGCFGQHALWCDYSGPCVKPQEEPVDAEKTRSVPSAIRGIACFNHPANPNEEVMWHVRDDGWMGPSLTRSAPLTIPADESIRVRYRLIAHLGYPGDAGIADRYRAWRREEMRQ